MAYSVNSITTLGRALIASASAQDPIHFTRVGSMVASIDPDEVDTPTASTCDGPWGAVRSVGSTDSTFRVIGEFTNSGDGQSVKTVVFFAKSTRSEEVPFAVLSDPYASIYIPGAQAPESKILASFTAKVVKALGTFEPVGSDSVATADFLSLKKRTVTAYSENDTTKGEAQTVRGDKTFTDKVAFGASGVYAYSPSANLMQIAAPAGKEILIGSVDESAYAVEITPSGESGAYDGYHVRHVSIEDYTLEETPIKWANNVLFGGDTALANDAYIASGEVTATGAYIDVGRRNDDDRATIFSWSDSERHVINEFGGAFTVETAENAGGAKVERFRVTDSGIAAVAGACDLGVSTTSISMGYDDGLGNTHSAIIDRLGFTVNSQDSQFKVGLNGASIYGAHSGGDSLTVDVHNGLFSVTSRVNDALSTQINVNHGVLTLPAGIGNLKDVLCNMGAAGVDGLTMLWVNLKKASSSYNAGDEISTVDGEIELHSSPYFNDEQEAGTLIPAARKFILLHGLRSDSIPREVTALVIRSN